jgi:hypothetical protein
MDVMTATSGTRKSAMTTYTIDKENGITALGSQQADFEGEIFASEQGLADLAPNGPPTGWSRSGTVSPTSRP